MEQEATRRQNQDEDQLQAAPAQQAGKQQDPDGDGVTNSKPGGKDALGTKENLLSPWFDEMVEVANELAPKFKPMGLNFRPEVLLATAMQEAANKDPLNAKSFDNGLGIMQITPYKGQLDPGVAKAIGWDNSKGLDYNMQHSKWRDAKANLTAGAETMLSKAVAVKAGVPQIWGQMDEPHKWRAILYAYNAGQGNAIKALKNGGPNASMISTFTDKSGKRVSHDYTAEIKAKMDYVDSHDPFAAAGEGPSGDTKKEDDADKPTGGGGGQDDNHIKKSVGRGGVNNAEDVHAVQIRLKERGVNPGTADSQIGPKTIGAIEEFQSTFLTHPDGLISPGKNTEKHLFGESGKVTVTADPKKEAAKPDEAKTDPRNEKQEEDAKKDGPDNDQDTPSYAAIAKNFKAGIPGSGFTWHDALWLPSWGRHAKPSDVTNTDMDTVLKNIEKQAAALQKVEDHVGKKIVIHCWLRPPKYNAQIGGASNSAHLRGMATDFHCEGMSAEAVRKAVKAKPDLYPGAGENNVSWNHLDLEHKKWFSP
ncbi:MAG TPA: D-Ala-D-Ala carboxypeptidase family metallohydrolase [Kofleriaceae bacterium]|nr:D-Ala-D-Ala carboxypeptidase family metallohydrolase [Kofleriaceae bacterium]